MLQICFLTFRELARSRIFTVIVFFTALLILSGIFLASISLGNKDRLLVDFGLSMIEISGLVTGVFIGSQTIAKEMEGRTWYLLFSKPLRRWEYFMGKYLGITGVIAALWAVETIVLTAVLWAQDAVIPALFFPASIGVLLSLILIIAVLFFFSTFTSPLTCLFVTVSIYMTSHAVYEIIDMGKRLKNVGLQFVGELLSIILPNLASLNIKPIIMTDAVLGMGRLSFGHLAVYVGHAGLYLICILGLGILLFRRKSFDTV